MKLTRLASPSLPPRRTRRRILKMNEKLAHAAAAASSSSDPSSSSSAAAPSAADIDARDQGFTRPKILLLTPFRSSALAALSTLLALFPPGTQIENRQRFLSEFSLPEGTTDRLLERAADWPKDHVDTFKGNVDDNFRVGVKVTRKSVKLFGGFYGCDIVVGSPLGLRMSIEKEKCVPPAVASSRRLASFRMADFPPHDFSPGRSADFLSSVEVVVADQLDVMSMQNWEHVQVRPFPLAPPSSSPLTPPFPLSPLAPAVHLLQAQRPPGRRPRLRLLARQAVVPRRPGLARPPDGPPLELRDARDARAVQPGAEQLRGKGQDRGDVRG